MTSIHINQPMFIIVMGVSGTGKSTLGQALAAELGLPFLDGDSLHPQANIDKMSAGHPLTDADREPWLLLIRQTMEQTHKEQQQQQQSHGPTPGVIVACSSLKRSYRDILRGRTLTESSSSESQRSPAHDPRPQTMFVFLDGARDKLLKRMTHRQGHFMKASMLDSQLDTLEDPRGESGVVVVSIEDSTQEQCRLAMAGLLSYCQSKAE